MWFRGVRLAGVAALAASAAVALPGAADAAGATLVVPVQYPTIQAAVDAAVPGDHIVVRAGVYTGEVVIAKDVDVRGAGIGRTVLKAPAVLTFYGVHLPDGRALTAVVRVEHGATVRMSDLTVSGPVPCGIEVSGINVLQAATLDLTRARVTDIRTDPATCTATDAAGRAIVYGIPPHIIADGEQGGTAYGRIDSVLVDRYQHAGISVAGPAQGGVTHVQITNDVIVGGTQLPSFQYGIDLGGNATARIAGNWIGANVCRAAFCGPDPINEAQGAGILVQSAATGTSIVGNVVTNNDAGVYQVDSPDCCTISRNLLAANRYFGVVIQDGDGATNGNRILGGRVGIAVVADFVDTTGLLHGDTVASTSVARVREIECCGVTARAVVS